MRLLFVGNSLTYYNGGLENHVRLLAASATPPRILVADRATQGGATLRVLHGLPSVHERIQQGHYDRVILQDDIPELTAASTSGANPATGGCDPLHVSHAFSAI